MRFNNRTFWLPDQSGSFSPIASFDLFPSAVLIIDVSAFFQTLSVFSNYSPNNIFVTLLLLKISEQRRIQVYIKLGVTGGGASSVLAFFGEILKRSSYKSDIFRCYV
ncbi:hypothetical protein ISN45_Aa01g039190 [Arabidopsis thaliana x Arabidopsis arenosa]|uniref:Transmembrane protein n=1 Tax=Arabidopsis thaliana x Arabidopsis arenosa TaxID=1240361 RepID=A0A8T2C7Y8_9BRAS|nr:hypothetical protein ISN45_Aa01g039190 [Arabidopsis thaliana x Arabidopsis arenosa]